VEILELEPESVVSLRVLLLNQQALRLRFAGTLAPKFRKDYWLNCS
jgi:hypothetical protein